MSNVTQLGVGSSHNCVLRDDGTVWCWGFRSSGRLGDGGPTTGTSGPAVQVAGISDAVQLAVGTGHGCVLRATGELACWGSGSAGALGDGTLADSPVPTTVVDTTGSGTLGGVERLMAGASYTCALRPGGEVACWGKNYYGEMGVAAGGTQPVPTVLPTVSDVLALGTGEDHICALINLGRDAVCWGRNRYGQTGDGTSVDHHTPAAVMGL